MGRTGRLLGASAGAVLGALAASALMSADQEAGGSEEARRFWMTRSVAPVAAALLVLLRGRTNAPVRNGAFLGLATYLGMFSLGGPVFGLAEAEWDRPSAGVGRRIVSNMTTGVLVSLLAQIAGGRSKHEA